MLLDKLMTKPLPDAIMSKVNNAKCCDQAIVSYNFIQFYH